MKKILAILFLLTFYSCGSDNTVTNTNTQTPFVLISSSSYSNWTFLSGFDLSVTLTNAGQANSTNLKLRFKYYAVNGPSHFYASIDTTWNDILYVQQSSTKGYSYSLPSGYRTDSLWISILSQ